METTHKIMKGRDAVSVHSTFSDPWKCLQVHAYISNTLVVFSYASDKIMPWQTDEKDKQTDDKVATQCSFGFFWENTILLHSTNPS